MNTDNSSLEPTEQPTVLTEYSSTVVQPLLIALMVTSLATAVLAVLQVGAAELPWVWIIGPCFLISLEGIYTTIWLHHPDRRSLNRSLYRTAELVIIVVITRLLTWFLAGGWPTASTWIFFLQQPLLILWDFFFLFTLFIIIFVWERSILMSYIFYYMSIDPAERAYYEKSTPQRRHAERPLVPHRTMLLNLYGRHWIGGGIFLAFMATLSTVNYPTLSDGITTVARLGMRTETLLALLIYFGTGFALLSQGRLAMMNARWLINGVRKTAAIERSWSRNTLFVLFIVGGIAAFLPLGSTTLIGRLLEIVIQFIAALVTFISFLILSIIALLFPNSQVGTMTLQEPPPEPMTPPAEFFPPSEPAFPFAGLIFWIVAIAIACLAVIFFLRERGLVVNTGFIRVIWQHLSAWWRSLWQAVTMQLTDWRDAVVTRLVRDEDDTATQRPWRFIRFNALTPRQKLRYFYLSTVRRAEEHGIGRVESETPIEYAVDLKAEWPQTGKDVDVLTAAFLQARYSNREITEEDVQPVQDHWKHIRAELKRRAAESHNKNERSEP